MSTELNVKALEELEKAKEQLRYWQHAVSKWQNVVEALEELSRKNNSINNSILLGASSQGRSRRLDAIKLAREYISQYGPARSANQMLDWMAQRGVVVPKNKLRQYLWAAEGFRYEESKGGWYLTND